MESCWFLNAQVKNWHGSSQGVFPKRSIYQRQTCHTDFLTHWGRDKMVDISQTIFSSAFSWMKMYEFRLRFHWNLFPRVQFTIFQHLVLIMAWRRQGDKPLSEPMVASLLTHICVARPQWVDINCKTHTAILNTFRSYQLDVMMEMCQGLYFYSVRANTKCVHDGRILIRATIYWLKLISHKAIWPPFRRRCFQTHFRKCKNFVFWLKFHWTLFLSDQLTIPQHWFR